MRLFTAIFTKPGRPAKSVRQLNDSTLAKARSLPRYPSRKQRKDESKTFILTPRGSVHLEPNTNKSINGHSRIIKANELKKLKKASELKKLNKKSSKLLKKHKEAIKRDNTLVREHTLEVKNVNLLFSKKLATKRKTSDFKVQLPNQKKLFKNNIKQPTKNKSLLDADGPATHSHRDNKLFKMLATSLREGNVLHTEPALDKAGSNYLSKRLRIHTEHYSKPSKIELQNSSKPTGTKAQTRSRSREAAKDSSPAVDSQMRFFTRRTTNYKRIRETPEEPQDRLNTGLSSSAEKRHERSKNSPPREVMNSPADDKASKFSPHLRSKWRKVVPELTAKKHTEADPFCSRRTLGEATIQRFTSLRSKDIQHRQRLETTETCSKEKRQQSSHLITTCRQMHKLRLKSSPRGSPSCLHRPVVKHMKSMQALIQGGLLVQTLKKPVDIQRECRLDDYNQAMFLSTIKLENCSAEHRLSPKEVPRSDLPDRLSARQLDASAALVVPHCRESPSLTEDCRLRSQLVSSGQNSSGKSKPKENMEEVFEQFPIVPQEPLGSIVSLSSSLKSRTLPVIVVRQSSNIYSLPVSKP